MKTIEAKDTQPTETEIVYTYPSGKSEVRYRRPYNSPEALQLIDEVLNLHILHGGQSPYSFRHV